MQGFRRPCRSLGCHTGLWDAVQGFWVPCRSLGCHTGLWDDMQAFGMPCRSLGCPAWLWDAMLVFKSCSLSHAYCGITYSQRAVSIAEASCCSAGDAGLLMVLYPLLPETPYWLVLNGNLEAADRVLQRMARINGVPLPQVTHKFRQALVAQASIGMFQGIWNSLLFVKQQEAQTLNKHQASISINPKQTSIGHTLQHLPSICPR